MNEGVQTISENALCGSAMLFNRNWGDMLDFPLAALMSPAECDGENSDHTVYAFDLRNSSILEIETSSFEATK